MNRLLLFISFLIFFFNQDLYANPILDYLIDKVQIRDNSVIGYSKIKEIESRINDYCLSFELLEECNEEERKKVIVEFFQYIQNHYQNIIFRTNTPKTKYSEWTDEDQSNHTPSKPIKKHKALSPAEQDQFLNSISNKGASVSISPRLRKPLKLQIADEEEKVPLNLPIRFLNKKLDITDPTKSAFYKKMMQDLQNVPTTQHLIVTLIDHLGRGSEKSINLFRISESDHSKHRLFAGWEIPTQNEYNREGVNLRSTLLHEVSIRSALSQVSGIVSIKMIQLNEENELVTVFTDYYPLGNMETLFKKSEMNPTATPNSHKIESNKLSLDEVLINSKRLCNTLAGIHKSGIIHKDIKPSNFLAKKDERDHTVFDFNDFGASYRINVNTFEPEDFAFSKDFKHRFTTEGQSAHPEFLKFGNEELGISYHDFEPEISPKSLMINKTIFERDRRNDYFGLANAIYFMATGHFAPWILHDMRNPFAGIVAQQNYSLTVQKALDALFSQELPLALKDFMICALDPSLESRCDLVEKCDALP